MKKINLKSLHIAMIILGIIFITISAFHANIWFDESYSVAIAKYNFADIWKITGNDVHPPFYYWMLHLVYLIFGNNTIAFRLFSVLAIAILGILGYTHIRKDFGEKTGILFSFLSYFLPVMCTYSQEIRMYSWACLLTCLMGIYAYRFAQKIKTQEIKGKNKTLVLFGVFSITCCYIHYYAMITAVVVNFILLIYLIMKRKQAAKDLRNFMLLAILQIILYIPWILYLLAQIKHVESGFWITLGVNTLVEVPSFQFRRQLDTNPELNLQTVIALIAATEMYTYIAYHIWKSKKENELIKPGILAIIVYVTVITIFLLGSLIFSPVLFSRYLFAMTGIYIFALAFFMAKEKKRWVTIVICTIIALLAAWSNITNIFINYDESNMKQVTYLKENIQPDDIIVYSNIGNGGVIAAFFPDNKQYFVNGAHWDVEEAYKAYGPGMETVYTYEETIKDYHGRIWLVDSENMGLYEEFPKEGITLLAGPERFDTKYQNYIYQIMLLEKE